MVSYAHPYCSRSKTTRRPLYQCHKHATHKEIRNVHCPHHKATIKIPIWIPTETKDSTTVIPSRISGDRASEHVTVSKTKIILKKLIPVLLQSLDEINDVSSSFKIIFFHSRHDGQHLKQNLINKDLVDLYYILIQRTIYHTISSLHPTAGCTPSYKWLYIYDAEEVTHIWMGNPANSQTVVELMSELFSIFILSSINKLEFFVFSPVHSSKFIWHSHRILECSFSKIELLILRDSIF